MLRARLCGSPRSYLEELSESYWLSHGLRESIGQ